MLTNFDIRELILLFPEYIPPNNQYMIKIKKKKTMTMIIDDMMYERFRGGDDRERN